MSAFIVSDKTINKVVGWVNDSQRRQFLEPILKVAELNPSDPDWQSKLGAKMFALNVEAVNARYGPAKASDGWSSGYTFAWELATDIQVLKSLSCWLYQCAEGDVPEQPLYKAFHDLEGRMAVGVVEELPAWQHAEWR